MKSKDETKRITKFSRSINNTTKKTQSTRVKNIQICKRKEAQRRRRVGESIGKEPWQPWTESDENSLLMIFLRKFERNKPTKQMGSRLNQP